MPDTFTDHATSFDAALTAAEQAFRARFHTRAETLLPNNLSLLYCKRKDEWGFAVASGNHFITPIAETNLTNRMMVATALTYLWSECEKAEAETIKQLGDATMIVQTFLLSVGS